MHKAIRNYFKLKRMVVLKNFVVRLLFIILVILIFSHCSIIDIRALQIITNPSEYNAVLSTEEIISVTFSLGVKQNQTENSIKITEFFSENSVVIDYIWDSTTSVILSTPEPLKTGFRYILSIDGTIETEKGGLFQKKISIPFYAIHESGPFQLESFVPEQDSTQNQFSPIEFQFNTAQNPEEFERLFLITPNQDLQYSWSEENKVVAITPIQKWTHLNRYSWTIPNTLTDANGTHILKSYNGNFVTQDDLTPPTLLSIQTGFYDREDGSFILYSNSLDDVRFTDSLLFNFSEPVDNLSLNTSFSISPSINANLIQYQETSWLYVPDEGWDQSVIYTLELSTQLKDLAGNSLLSDYRTQFIPAILPIKIDLIEGFSTVPASTMEINSTEFNTNIPFDITSNALGNTYYIKLSLSEGEFSTYSERLSFVQTISFEGFIPPIGDPTITNILWIDDHTLTITYSNLIKGGSDPWNQQLYRLIIRSDKSSKNTKGQYLQEDIYVVLRSK